jgi:hypothetical protein
VIYEEVRIYNNICIKNLVVSGGGVKLDSEVVKTGGAEVGGDLKESEPSGQTPGQPSDKEENSPPHD